MRTILLKTLFLNCFCFIMVPFICYSQKTEETPIYTLLTNYEWGDNTQLTDIKKSLLIDGVQWSAYGFINNEQKREQYGTDGFYYGLPSILYTPYIYSLNPLKYKINKIKCYISFPFGIEYGEFLQDGNVEICDTPDFDESTKKINILKISKSEDTYYYYFMEGEILEPKPNQYYRINFKFKEATNIKQIEHAFCLRKIEFYGSNDFEEEVVLSAPSVTEGIATGDGAKKVFSFKSDSGELHILASVFNYDYTFIKDLDFTISNQAPSNSPMRSIAATDREGTDWRNKVADKNEEFLIYPEQESKHFTKVRAKSVDGDTQSEELVTWFHNGGITTGILEISDNEKIELWYNLQGERVTNPSNGMFIHVINGKANKVIIP